MTVLSRIYHCWIRREHVWGRAFDQPVTASGYLGSERVKKCKHCSAIAQVKTRKRRAA